MYSGARCDTCPSGGAGALCLKARILLCSLRFKLAASISLYCSLLGVAVVCAAWFSLERLKWGRSAGSMPERFGMNLSSCIAQQGATFAA